jgi:predicted SnoaL-like aldol condensation-catalyzing enzyme
MSGTPTELRLVHRLFEEVFAERRLAALDDLVTHDYVEHKPGVQVGRDGYRAHLDTTLPMLQWMRGEVLDVITCTDRVVARSSWSGRATHQPASSGDLAWSAIDIWRVQDGRFAEHWDQIDSAALLVGMGMLVTAPSPDSG